MTFYNRWFNKQIEKNSELYFDIFTNLSELQRTALNNLKCNAINFENYKLIIDLITNRIKDIITKEEVNEKMDSENIL